MAGALISAKIEDSGIKETLSAILARASDMRPVWMLVGQIILESSLRNFEERRSPDGTAWQEVSERYARWKSKKGHDPGNILVLNNRLMRSINVRPETDHVVIGTNVVYAAIHQFGGAISSGGRTQVSAHREGGGFMSRKQASRKKSGSIRISISDVGPHTATMPARKYLGVRAEDWPRIHTALANYLVRGTA